MSRRKAKPPAPRRSDVGHSAPAGNNTKILSASATFSGPLPHPELLHRYDVVIPGLAERIVAMAEGEQKHRHVLEGRALTADALTRMAGVVSGFLLGLVGLGGSLYLAYLGKDLAGIGGILGTLGGLAGVFIWGRRSPGQR